MICVGLGSNLGSREAYLLAAERLLDGRDDVHVERRSSLYVTPPMGPPQPDYLNAALRLRSELHPRALLRVLLEIERALGRRRSLRWGPRVIDLDILYWSEGEVDEPGLRVPHAGLADRPFAIAPLLDVAPELSGRWACERPSTRPWSTSPEHAIDAMDTLALAASASLGPPVRAMGVEAWDGVIPEKGPAFIVLERWDEEHGRGSKLL